MRIVVGLADPAALPGWALPAIAVAGLLALLLTVALVGRPAR